MTKLFIIRHAESEGNLYHRIQGQYDSRLTRNGEAQLQALQARFRDVPLQACYSSDLFRARRTAEAVFPTPQLDPRFRDIRLGIWENRCFGEIKRTEPEALKRFTEDPAAWTKPGAESYHESTTRFLTALTEAAERHDGQSIAVVSHGSVIRNALMELFDRNGSIRSLPHADNTAVSLLEYENGAFRLLYANDSSHLTESISTLAQQSWWQGGAQKNDDLWFLRFDGNREKYCAMRTDAWQTIYGNVDELDAEGFYQEACNIQYYHPDSAAYAMLEEKTAGFIQLTPARARDAGVGYISLVYLCPELRGRGIGAQLIGYAADYYRARRRTKLQLACAPCNLRARRFYEKLGFRQVGTTPGLHNDLLLLQQDLLVPPVSGSVNNRVGGYSGNE